MRTRSLSLVFDEWRTMSRHWRRVPSIISDVAFMREESERFEQEEKRRLRRAAR